MKCFTLYVMNLKYMKVSLFEMLQEKSNFFHHIVILLDVPVYRSLHTEFTEIGGGLFNMWL